MRRVQADGGLAGERVGALPEGNIAGAELARAPGAL